MRLLFGTVLVFLLCPLTCLAQDNVNQTNSLASEAKKFMDAYAVDLRDHNAEAIAGRYSRSGAYALGAGAKVFRAYDEIKSTYLEKWRGPSSFEWQDISYELLGPDAVMVAGKFSWGRGDTREPLVFSYTGILLREDGELRIRLEDESFNPQSIKEFLCAPKDSTP